MNLQDLTADVHAGNVDELNLISIEGGIYLLEARTRGVAQLLTEMSGKTMRLRSVEHARDVLQLVPTVPFNLVHSLAHDEMCGLPSVEKQTLRLPISLRSTL